MDTRTTKRQTNRENSWGIGAVEWKPVEQLRRLFAWLSVLLLLLFINWINAANPGKAKEKAKASQSDLIRCQADRLHSRSLFGGRVADTATQLGNNADTCHIYNYIHIHMLYMHTHIYVSLCGLVGDRRRCIVAACLSPTSDKLIGHFGPKGNSAAELQVASC